MKTRKEFLEAVIRMANLKDLKEADAAARAVISLTKLIIGEELSQRIAEILPLDLREGWESVSHLGIDLCCRIHLFGSAKCQSVLFNPDLCGAFCIGGSPLSEVY